MTNTLKKRRAPKIPLMDLDAQYRAIQPEIDEAIQRVIKSSGFILGKEVEAFEHEFAAFVGSKHGVGVSSGTAALHLALLACGVRPGDEVITTPLTFIATAEAVRHAGALPVFVDVEQDSLCLDPSLIASAVTPRTKAILVVHLHGNPAAMDAILEAGGRYGLTVIEDAAQAHGAEYRGRRAGSLGAAGCFSFFPGKNLGAYGDAGAVVSNDRTITDTVGRLRDHGRRGKYEHEVEGFNHRMDAIQAAVLRVKLRHLEKWNRRRREIAARYRNGLRGVVACPQERRETVPAYHVFAVRTPRREELRAYLADQGVETGIHYPIPLHLQPALRFLKYEAGRFPAAEQAAQQLLSLPIHPDMTDEQVDRVIDRVRAFF